MRPWHAAATLIVCSLLTFELIVLAMLILFPYSPNIGAASLNGTFYNLLSPLSTVLLLGLLYTWLLRIGATKIRIRSAKADRIIHFASEPFRTIRSTIRNLSPSDLSQQLR